MTDTIQQLLNERVVIENASPEIDAGRFVVRRTVGDLLRVEADIYTDGHNSVAAVFYIRADGEAKWREVSMQPLENDRWFGEVGLSQMAHYSIRIEAWIDEFGNWLHGAKKKRAAGVDLELELAVCRKLLAKTRAGAKKENAGKIKELEAYLDTNASNLDAQYDRLFSEDTVELMAKADLRANLARSDRELRVFAQRRAASYSAWYELFPRSMSDDVNRHGTFDDVIKKLPYVRDLGFDVLYFPPIHPIGMSNRKGKNNTLTAYADDVGSPYAIGSEAGGHSALHPELGDFEALERLRVAAAGHGLELAIDVAINASPDHPWIKSNPKWFDWLPDGSLRYAENPPKKYQDISNVDFYADGATPSLWNALRDMFLFWVSKGIKIFRVDNPHTKPIPFWEWVIAAVQKDHPDTIFLAEAFTRPKIMRRLGKVGFTQSYSYFTWRNTKAEIIDYMTEVTRGPSRDYYLPNFFVNTPDINPVYLQTSGRPGFRIRAALAATLSTSWGLYSGFELCESTPLPGKEEYLNSEKFEIKAWDWDRPGNIKDDVRHLNRIRHENPALQQFPELTFHNAWNDNILVYSKMDESRENLVLIAVTVDPHNYQGCDFEAPIWLLGLEDHQTVLATDLVSGQVEHWNGKIHHIGLDPHIAPYRIWRLSKPKY